MLFVSISINLKTIVSETFLAPRAAKGLTSLVGVLVTGSVCLEPRQDNTLLGAELIVLGALVWLMATSSRRAASGGNP